MWRGWSRPRKVCNHERVEQAFRPAVRQQKKSALATEVDDLRG
jgi:hypothetical protein